MVDHLRAVFRDEGQPMGMMAPPRRGIESDLAERGRIGFRFLKPL
jgi:hypothetical protein